MASLFLGAVLDDINLKMISSLFRILLLTLLTGFFPVSMVSAEPEKLRLQLQWKHQFEYAGFYAAIEKGYYAEQGLDVELIEFGGGGDSVDEVLSGNAGYGIGYSSVVLEYLRGKPLVMLANYFKRSPLAIVAQPDIKSPRDLAGRTLMGNSDSIQEITLLAMLDKFDVTTDMINIVPPSFSTLDFINGKVDAMVIYTTNELYFLERSNINFNLFDPLDYGLKYYDLNLFTSQQEATEHPDRARRFVAASNKGWEYALKHSNEMVDIILEKYNTQEKSRGSLLYEAKQIRHVMLPEFYPLGDVDRQRLNIIGADFKQLGLLDQQVELDFDKFLMAQKILSSTLDDDDYLYINQRGKVNYCIDPSWMPFESLQGGEHDGMTADFFDLLRRKSGLDLQLIPTTSWPESLEFARQRRCDLLSLAMETPERKVYMNFTSPYLIIPLVIATRMDTLFINGIEGVLDKPLGMVKGYAYHEFLRQRYPQINLVEVDSLNDGLDKVRTGELFGLIDSLATIGYRLQKDFIGELKIAGKFDFDWSMGVAVRNDEPMLLQIMQKAVDSISEDDRREIYNKWISVNYEKGTDYQLLLKVVIGASLVLLFLSYHLMMQSRYVRQLKSANDEISEKNRLLEVLSITDRLTGINNRSKLDMELQRYYELYQRYQKSFSLILIDIDFFKAINDNCGHPEGDKVLKQIADLFSSHVRKTDVIGRWGGEEFLIICPDTTVDHAAVLAEKLRTVITEVVTCLDHPVTISAGVVECGPMDDIQSMLVNVDKALYEAKNGGRNQVVTFS